MDGTAQPRSIVRHPWRVAVVVIALLAVLNLGFLLAASSDTSEPAEAGLPSSVERVEPEPGSTTGLLVDVAVDLRNGLTGVLAIDGVCIPEDQLTVDESLGTVTFRPGEGKEFERFEPRTHDVVVTYRDAREPKPDNPCTEFEGAFRWSFRATS
jgi:hypothetical protein